MQSLKIAPGAGRVAIDIDAIVAEYMLCLCALIEHPGHQCLNLGQAIAVANACVLDLSVRGKHIAQQVILFAV